MVKRTLVRIDGLDLGVMNQGIIEENNFHHNTNRSTKRLQFTYNYKQTLELFIKDLTGIVRLQWEAEFCSLKIHWENSASHSELSIDASKMLTAQVCVSNKLH